jgi:prepilin-type N-terminal cleavage/methylation domain-containing protein
MSARGITLIEMMVAVAILGIGVTTLGAIGTHHRKAGLAELQRARAQVLLEYRAECLVGRVAPDPLVLARLEEGLPGLTSRVHRVGRVEQVDLSFRPAEGPPVNLSLAVVPR